jgi:hypothetical protein
MNSRFVFSPRIQAGARRISPFLGLFGICLCLTTFLPIDGLAKTKPPRVPRPEPELKIVDLNIAPTPYAPSNGPLEFSVTVQLPKELNGATILEVTSLISSPSKTSLRFLAHRQPVQVPATPNGGTERSTLSINLSWDGQDHRKQLAGPGTYAYEVRTKLLANGEKGPRTMMVAWPKRGTLEVR